MGRPQLHVKRLEADSADIPFVLSSGIQQSRIYTHTKYEMKWKFIIGSIQRKFTNLILSIILLILALALKLDFRFGFSAI
jgi:hypothetical protein